MNASGVNQYLSPARSAATACAYSCPYSTERSGRMFPFILMQTKRPVSYTHLTLPTILLV